MKKDKAQKKARKEVKFKHPEAGLRNKLFRKLYANEAEGLYLLVTYLPFFAASWISGGLVLDQLIPFGIISIVILISNYGKSIIFDKQIIFKKEFSLILAAANVALLFVFYNYTALISATLFLAFSTLLYFIEIQLKNSSPFVIILKSISLISRMSIYSYLGIVSQRLSLNSSHVLEYAVFGFVPGCILAGSLITRYSQIFLNSAWKREVIKKNKRGEDIKRPGSLTRLLSSFIVIGPALPLLLTPFDIFPTPFLAIAFLFNFIIKNLEAYLKAERSDAILAVEQANIALAMSFLLLVVGLLIRVGIT